MSLYLSYVPLLSDARGMSYPLERKSELMEMLTSAANEYRIQAVAWSYLDPKLPGTVFPIVLVNHGPDIADHIVKWSRERPDKYFSLVWKKIGAGYDLAILPDFNKSARRFHAETGQKELLTILGHIFTYQVLSSDLDITVLDDRSKVRVGWAPEVGPNGEVKDYREIILRCRSYAELSQDEKETLAPYFRP